MTAFHEVRNRDIYFRDFSDGERLFIALAMVIRILPPGGMFTIAQRLNEGLDNPSRLKVAGLLRDTKVVAVTARCDEGQLRAVVY